MATNGVVQHEENISNLKEVFSQLNSVLEELRVEEFTWDEDINFLQTFVRDPQVKALAELNDHVAESQSFEQPLGAVSPLCYELQASAPHKYAEERDLVAILQKPHIKSILLVHDTVRSRNYETPLPAYDPNFHPQTQLGRHRHHGRGPEFRVVGLHKDTTEALGITMKLVNNKLIIARILYGGLIHRQGLLQVGDRIVEVNQELVDSMNPSDLQALLKNSSGSLVIKVEPGYHEPAGLTELFVRAHFDYNPRQDRLIPSQDAGMTFRKGDILKILNQEDSFWWQAMQHSDRSVAGLVPSQILEERRKAFKSLDGRAQVGCIGGKKPKKKVMYSSHHSGEFESYNLVLYEPVVQVENFQYRTLVLIGAPNIGRRSLKTRLLTEHGTRFSEVKAHTTRPPKSTEDRNNFNFVSEEHMRREIMAHKFIEFGKYQQHLYGIKSESVVDIINTGKMCILDVHPQALKLLRTPQFRPLVVFVKAANAEGVKKLHSSARVDNPAGHSLLSEEDYDRCAQESIKIEGLYGHYFDATIVNENIDIAYEELLATIRVFSTGKHWVPANWVM
ncbi:protein PALS2-like [Halichondria panicea]|uniref:protein PALS2-like n=1 Tax=Halichondria panicea TaxID=6063 RepID=UPI00312BB6E3